MLIAVDEESLINSDIANRRKRIMDGQLIDKLGRRIEQQQAEINRLREALSFYATQKTMIKSVRNGKPCRMIYCCADVAEKALNGESEGK